MLTLSSELPLFVRNKVINKRLIFTVTTGRSGTGYLYELIKRLPGIDCFHEPEPNFAEVLRQAQKDSRIARNFWVNKKLKAICSFPNKLYVETSHLFCKGFVEPLINLGIVPDIIILTRPHRSVALSLWKLDTIPGRTKNGLKYLLSPDDPGVLFIPGWQRLNDYQLCYWYCLEIERRSCIYKNMFLSMGAKVFSTSLFEITSNSGFNNMIKELALPKPGWMQKFKNFLIPIKITNQKKHKKRTGIPNNIDMLELGVKNLINYARN